MHCYQASKVSHLMGTVHTSQNHYFNLPASSLVYSGFVLSQLFLQLQRLEMQGQVLCQEDLAQGRTPAGCSTHPGCGWAQEKILPASLGTQPRSGYEQEAGQPR